LDDVRFPEHEYPLQVNDRIRFVAPFKGRIGVETTVISDPQSMNPAFQAGINKITSIPRYFLV
jgi:hypothetical protein